jgi:hypothetical protein
MLAGLSRTERVAKEPGLDSCIQFPCRFLQLHRQWSTDGVWLVEEAVDVYLVKRVDSIAKNRGVCILYDTLEAVT